MPGATCRSRPQAAAEASAVRLGTRAVSSSERPVSGRGRPPNPSSERSTIFVVFDTTSGRMRSSMTSVYRRVLRLLDRDLQPAQRVAPHVSARRHLRHGAHATTDPAPQLDLPIELLARARAQDRITGADDRGVPLAEDRRLLRNGVAGFLGVIAIVQADADELARIGDGRVQPRGGRRHRHPLPYRGAGGRGGKTESPPPWRGWWTDTGRSALCAGHRW